MDVGRRWRAWRRRGERERWLRGLGVGVLYGRRGKEEVDMGRRWRSWRRPGERERRERGLGGCGGTKGRGSGASGWLRCGGGVGSVGAVGECAVRGGGAPPFAGPGLIARVGPVRRCWRVLGGFAWCCLVLGRGGSPVVDESAT